MTACGTSATLRDATGVSVVDPKAVNQIDLAEARFNA